MRIALFTEVLAPKIDGISNRLDHTVRHLKAGGHDVLLFAPAGSVAEIAGARVVRVPGVPFPPYPGLQISAPDPRIVLELSRFAPDVVHAVGPACLGVWGILAAHALRLPIVASYHTDLPRYLASHRMQWLAPVIWPLIESVHGRAHLNLAPSRFTRGELLAHGIEPVDLWRGGVDVELFHPRRRNLAMRMRLSGGVPDRPIALYAGRLSPEKQLDRLCDLHDALPEIRVAFVGDGPARAQLEARLGGERASFLGFLRGEELAQAFASADVFVMPSTTETLGFVVLEAMASGLPVVAARAGGVCDQIDSEIDGLLYEPGAPDEAVKAVYEILASRDLRERLARRARARAERCDWAHETQGLVMQYRKTQVLAANRGRASRLLRAML
jgi:glycosyltransferase involved in cell wall biosynthesis